MVGRELLLETRELREHYLKVLAETPASTAFTKSVSGGDVSYSWQSKDKLRTFLLGKTNIRTERGTDAQGKAVYETAEKWSFTEQVEVLKPEVEGFLGALTDADQKIALRDALDLDENGNADETTDDVDAFTVYTRSTSGADVSYSWRSRDEARTYSISSERIKDASGKLMETKRTFTVQYQVVKLEVSGHDTNLDTAALKTQYRDALADTVAGTVFTKSVSGKDINYSWKSAAVEGTTYSLARSREKIYVARTGVVDGATRVLTDDDGDIVYDIIEDFSWNFSAQTYVAPLTALTEAGSLGANLEVQEQKDQYASALLDTDRATAFTRTTSGANVSYSWKSVEGGKTYNLGYEVVKIHAADGARVEERAKWLFSEQSYVAKSVVEGRAANLSTAELKAQYAAALSDTDGSTYYTQIISGSDLSFSWESVDGGRTYSFPVSASRSRPAKRTGSLFTASACEGTFSAQFRVVRMRLCIRT